MQSTVPSRPAVLADLFAGDRARDILLVVGFTLAIALGAQVAVPLPGTPVPVTAETLVVLLGAAALGRNRALGGTVAYLALGVVGIPWFAASSGATVGYIVGFAVAAALVGGLAGRGADRTVPRATALMLVGNLVIYAFGVAWLAVALDVGMGEAVSLGLVPFLVGDALKIVIAALALPTAWRLLDRQP